MSIVRRRTLVRAAAVTACAGSLLAVPTAAALAEGVPAASSAHSPAPQRTLVKTLALADGVSTANVYRVSKGVYQAEILGADGHRTTLTSGDGSTGGTGALHAALDSDGRLTSWAGNVTDPQGGHVLAGDGHKTGTRSGHAVLVAASDEAGTVQRLGNLADGPGEGVLLLAAGGGIAAVGAAGLGFAMLRRGRTNG
ncbi:hypothetical protein ACFXB3_16085 [Streptomyces sp. NPDC059447]|uniref:hypothetical protein n=1 Tax=Streptomyces sp. NPDC059447 TaxID=3346834 RepID=UPI0036C111F6